MSKRIDNSYKPLISVCEIIGRIGFRGYTRNDIVEDYKGAISLSPANINNNRLSLNNCTYISWEKYYESPEIMIAQNDIIFCKTGSVGKTAIIHHVACKMTINPQLTIFRSKEVHPSYLYYVIISNRFQKEVNKLKGTGSVSTISQKDLGNIIIPIPTSIVQEEIVKILDSFTNLIDALNEELSLRQKQFEYYREKLLTFDETVERLSFGNDFSLKARIGWQGLTKKEYRKSGDYYLITGTDFKDGNKIDFSTCVYVDEERYTQDPNIQIKPNDVLITKDGTLGKVAFIEKMDKPATLNGGVFVVRSKVGGVIPKYVAYYLSSPIFKNWIEQNHTNGSIMHLTQKLLVKFEIAIPSTDVQQSIVEKLDAFESLISSLKEEIALRQKQYEYYREKLLTFD